MANPGLTFTNQTSATVYVALLTYDSGCGPTDPWRKSGWYAIPPGGSSTLIGNDLRTLNRYLAWFADDWAGGPSWSGTYNYLVTNNAFNQCYDDNNGCDVYYAFQELDINGAYGIIVYLTAPGKFQLSPYGPPPPSDDGDSWGDDGDDAPSDEPSDEPSDDGDSWGDDGGTDDGFDDGGGGDGGGGDE